MKALKLLEDMKNKKYTTIDNILDAETDFFSINRNQKNVIENIIYQQLKPFYFNPIALGTQLKTGDTWSSKAHTEHFRTFEGYTLKLYGNTFKIKDELKAKGYKYDSTVKAWYKTIETIENLISDVETYKSYCTDIKIN
jgi:hypothetical protein